MPVVITSVGPSSTVYAGELIHIFGSGFGTTDCNFTLWVRDKIDATHPNGYFYAIVTSSFQTGGLQTDTQQDGLLASTLPSASNDTVVYAFNNTTAETSNYFPVTLTAPPPSITSVTPNPVSINQNLTVTGTNFGAYDPSLSKLEVIDISTGVTVEQAVASWSDTSIVTNAPIFGIDDLTAIGVDLPQSCQVRVTSASSNTGTWVGTLVVNPQAPPAIDTITPNPVINGGTVTLTGSLFGANQGGARFVDALGDSYQLTIASWTDTQITVTAGWPPPFAPETGQVSVFRASDNYQSNVVNLTVNPAPPVTPLPPPIDWSGTAASIQGDAVRITQLDASGAPTLATYTFAGFISLKMVPTYGGGELVGSRSANGLPGRRIRLPLLVVKAALELTICGPSIRATYELQGGRLQITNNYGSGYAAPLPNVIPCRDVAIEVWSKTVDSSGRHLGYYRWLFPYVNMNHTSDTTFDFSAAVAPVFTGWSRANPAFGAGRDGFWTDQSGRAYQYAWDGSLPVIDDVTVSP